MNDERTWLCGILSKPDDRANRQAYADWLDERGDPRAPFLRMDPELERLSYVDWLEKDGQLDAYLKSFPDVKREAAQRQATARQRAQRRALAAKLDADWVAFIDTMGCPFEPFYFFNNGGKPRECRPEELPFAEPIGTRGPVVTFESDFCDERSWDPGLLRDLGFLTQLELKNCSYGAAFCPTHPFLCELKTKRRRLTGADVIASLRPRAFQGRHIPTLDATRIAYPGYKRGDGQGAYNDEIHNDFNAQYIFKHGDEEIYDTHIDVEADDFDADSIYDFSDEDDEGGDADESAGAHGKLKRFVADGAMWYVLLHTTPEPRDEFWFSRYAILLAVGLSPHGDRLLGVITHQRCHNLCD